MPVVHAQRKKNPRCTAGTDNFAAKIWRLRSPANRVYEFRNLREFIRSNPELFTGGDADWVESKTQKWCRALNGLTSLAPRGKGEVRGSWKGWTWYSITERIFNDDTNTP